VFRKVLLLLSIIVAGGLLVACDSSDVKFPDQGQEFSITVGGSPNGNSSTQVTVKVDHGQMIKLPGEDVFWIYDVPEERSEYIVTDYAPAGSLKNIYMHLRISKKPSTSP
jgi:hypothetical protein